GLRKVAVATLGPPPATEGVTSVHTAGIELHYRQFLQVPGQEPLLTTSVHPRRLTVTVKGNKLVANASYA
ncbi:MAG: hypothetical protein M1115_08420, partial [Actinobacteria bacterium]|nr:hypothetical protein [Actinomycetota bacterium]